DEAKRLVNTYEEALELVPDGPRGATVLAFLANALAPRLPSTVARLDAELSSRDPRAGDPVRRAAAYALLDLKSQEPWCENDRAACVEFGLTAAQRLRAAAPERCEGHALVAELRVASGDAAAGFGELERSLDHLSDRSFCARRLVSLAE